VRFVSSLYHPLHELIEESSQANECATIGNGKINRLLFEDDLVLLSSTESVSNVYKMTLQLHVTTLG